MKKIINITHSDFDGATCAILMKEFCRQKGYECKVYKAKYDLIDALVAQVHKEADNDTLIFLTDICPTKIPESDNIILIDHHVTATKSNIKKKFVNAEEGVSAAKMVYEYMGRLGGNYNEKYAKLVSLAHDYDTYTLSTILSSSVNYLYYLYNFERFVDRFKNGFEGFTEDEKVFLTCKMKQIKELLTNTEFSAIIDDVAFVIAEDHINEIARNLYDNKGFQYVFIYSPKRKTLGMRSRRDAIIHCGEFLELLGGGGHRCSAGIVVKNDEHVQEILKSFEVVYDEYHPPF